MTEELKEDCGRALKLLVKRTAREYWGGSCARKKEASDTATGWWRRSSSSFDQSCLEALKEPPFCSVLPEDKLCQMTATKYQLLILPSNNYAGQERQETQPEISCSSHWANPAVQLQLSVINNKEKSRMEKKEKTHTGSFNFNSSHQHPVVK